MHAADVSQHSRVKFFMMSKNSVSNQLGNLRFALLVQKLFKAFSVQGCLKLFIEQGTEEHGTSTRNKKPPPKLSGLRLKLIVTPFIQLLCKKRQKCKMKQSVTRWQFLAVKKTDTRPDSLLHFVTLCYITAKLSLQLFLY